MRGEQAQEFCGVPHPTIPGLLCERVKCVEYHLSEGVVWTDGAAKLPPKRVATKEIVGLVRRATARRMQQQDKAQGSGSSS